MLGLQSYVKYAGDTYFRGTIIGETKDKWIVDWWNPFNKENIVTKPLKQSNGLIEIMMYDEPVKVVGDRLAINN